RCRSDHNVSEALYDQPKPMPDGSLYSIIRYQGRFAATFPLEKYPFDTQFLKVMMEDTVSGADRQVYVPDGEHPVTLDPVITLPGFNVGKPPMRIVANPYPVSFGDLAEPQATA